MSILDRLRGGNSIPANCAFQLTQNGREKLQQNFGNDPKYRVLVTLETNGTSDMEEISRASGLSRGQVERLLPVLMKLGYIQPTTTGMGGVD